MSFKEFLVDEIRKLTIEKNHEIKVLKDKIVQLEEQLKQRDTIHNTFNNYYGYYDPENIRDEDPWMNSPNHPRINKYYS